MYGLSAMAAPMEDYKRHDYEPNFTETLIIEIFVIKLISVGLCWISNNLFTALIVSAKNCNLFCILNKINICTFLEVLNVKMLLIDFIVTVLC